MKNKEEQKHLFKREWCLKKKQKIITDTIFFVLLFTHIIVCLESRISYKLRDSFAEFLRLSNLV